MIKNIIIGMSMVLFAAGFAGCADWVNVTPKDQVESDKLFNSEQECPYRYLRTYDAGRNIR